MSLGFGYRARIGHLYPSGGLCDYEPQLMAPDGVQFITTRLPFPATGRRDNLNLVADLENHASMLTDANVDIVALNCTAATLLAGPDTVNQRVTATTGLPSVTTIEAVLAALGVTKMHRIALITPYPDDIVRAEIDYLRTHGIEVIAHHGLPCPTPVAQAEITPKRWRQLAETLDHSDVDGLLFSCAGIRVSTELDTIEHVTGVPVVASNQALLWHLLRILSIHERPIGFGSLLAGTFDTSR
jgi:maleate isomerase